MAKIKRTWDLEKEDLPYIMHPKRGVEKLKDSVCLSHRTARVMSGDYITIFHCRWNGDITSTQIEEGKYVVLDFRPQYYAVEQETFKIERFIPHSLKFNIEHILGVYEGHGEPAPIVKKIDYSWIAEEQARVDARLARQEAERIAKQQAQLMCVNPTQAGPENLHDIHIALNYTDLEATPAIEVPYLLKLASGEERRGTLDKKGKAVEKGVLTCSGEIEFYPDENSAAIDQEITGLYTELAAGVEKSARELRNWYKEALKNLPPAKEQESDETAEKAQQLREAVTQAVNTQLAQLKQRKDAYDALAWYEQAWEGTKSAASGVGKGVTDYIPDLGELGTLMDDMDIDVAAMADALATGDISELEKQFQEWKNRSQEGYEEAAESMEIVILLLSDTKTREQLASLPQKFLEVTPADELIEIGVAQGTQTGLDVGAVTGATIVGGLVTAGPGAAVGAGVAMVATTGRKAAKVLEAITKVLNKLVKALKKKRNKNGYNNVAPKTPNKSQLPEGKANKKKPDRNDDIRVVIKEGSSATLKLLLDEQDKPNTLDLHAVGTPSGGTYSWDIENKELWSSDTLKGKKVTLTAKNRPKKGEKKQTFTATVTYKHKGRLAKDKIKITIEPYRRIYLHAFAGARDGKSLFEWRELVKQHERDGTQGPSTEECLLYTGHVGISFGSKTPIYGFNPSTGDKPGWEVISGLKEKLSTEKLYPGVITDDSSVFKSAKRKGLNYKVLEYQFPESEYEKIYKKFLKEKTKTNFTYSFPDKGGDCNCATWPKKIGIPIPIDKGNMKVYIGSFDHNEVRVIGEDND